MSQEPKFTPEGFEEWFERVFGNHPVFGPDEIAEKLKCSPETIRRRLRMGEIEGYKLGSGDKTIWVITRDSLKRWLINCYWLNWEE